MDDNEIRSGTTRRSALKAVGAAGLFTLAGVTGTAAAREENGAVNGIGTFLNEKAAFKEHPIWTGGVADMRGMEVVTVYVGTMTSTTLPDFPELPVAYAPLVVEVSPGATVEWTWITNPFDVPVEHDVVSLKEEGGTPLFDSGLKTFLDADPYFVHTFEGPGNYLYYCTPHGAPDENAFGMRGAVKVAGKAI